MMDHLADVVAKDGDDPVFPPNIADVPAELHARLVDTADRAGVLDLTYQVVDSPYGGLLLAATGNGLVRVAFEVEGHDDVLERLATVVSPRILRSPRRTDGAARQIQEYFDGRRRRFDVPLDLRLVTGFRREVIRSLADIEYGSTATYGVIAERAGNAGAVRAVGSACSHNPVPVVLPCHRVVRSDGTIGNYLGGADVKRALLDLEAA